MPRRPDREFRLPDRSRVPRWTWLVALALHVPLVFLLVSRRNGEVAPLSELHRLAIGDSVRAFPLPGVVRDPPALRRTPPPARSVVPSSTPVALSAAATLADIPAAPLDTPPAAGGAELQPHYGGGRLWVRPLPESPRTIAKTLTGKTDKQLTDSAVAAMVQTYLDAMAREQAANLQTLPSWTTRIGGKTVGLDSKWIYLGPIKIPTMLLALLPIHVQGNMSNYQYNQQLQLMRSDLFEAGRRAATYDDFKKAVHDLHEQTELRREFTRNQQTPPDTSHHR